MSKTGTFGVHAPSGLPTYHDGIEPRVLGCLPKRGLYEGRSWKDSEDVIPRSQWQEFDDGQLGCAVRDQDGHSSCTGSIAYALAFARVLEGAPYLELSGAYSYSWINGGRDQGATIDDAADEIVKHGTCLVSTVGEDALYRKQAGAGDTEAQRFRASGKIPVRSFDELCSALLLKRVVYFGIEIGQKFNPDADGFLPDLRGSGGGHALYAANGLKKKGGKWYARVPNSWSARWGVQGICYMPESYFMNTQYGLGYALRPGLDVQDDPTDDTVPPVAKS